MARRARLSRQPDRSRADGTQRRRAERAAAARDVPLRLFFARKANKALALVDEAARLGHGVDVASERELRQVLDRGVSAEDVVVTAAIKPGPCSSCASRAARWSRSTTPMSSGFWARSHRSAGKPARIAIRLAPALLPGATPTPVRHDGQGDRRPATSWIRAISKSSWRPFPSRRIRRGRASRGDRRVARRRRLPPRSRAPASPSSTWAEESR